MVELNLPYKEFTFDRTKKDVHSQAITAGGTSTRTCSKKYSDNKKNNSLPHLNTHLMQTYLNVYHSNPLEIVNLILTDKNQIVFISASTL